MQEKKVVREEVNVTIKAPELGYEVSLDDLNKKVVNVHLYKGKCSAQDVFELERTIMFRLKIQFVGNLAKYIPIDAAAARETVETIDLDLDLLELFFCKKETSKTVKIKFGPIVDKYLASAVGKHIGTLTMSYEEFTELVVFIRYLSYASFSNDNCV